MASQGLKSGKFQEIFGGSGPWTRDGVTPDPTADSPDYADGYDNIPAHFETPSELGLDELVMPRRNGANAEAYSRRAFRLSVGNVTGAKNGPPED